MPVLLDNTSYVVEAQITGHAVELLGLSRYCTCLLQARWRNDSRAFGCTDE